MTKNKTQAQPRNPLTPRDLERIQSATARKNGGQVLPGSHVGRMQRHSAKQTDNGGMKK
jgi:hypothetical protein